MIDDVFDPAEHQPAPRPPLDLKSWLRRACVVGAMLCAATAVWWMTRKLLSLRSAQDNAATLSFVLPFGMMGLVIGGFLWQEFRWYRPRRKLLHLMTEISAARMPIDSLKEVGGGARSIASAVAAGFHQARLLQQKLAEQQVETAVKVQNRADALERVIGSLRQQAIRDGLTGLLNRRALDELLPRLIDHSRSREEDLALLMIDVDYFKQLNDQLGHAAGDDLLKNISQIIRSSLSRSADVGFRCGGDEFIAVLPGCGPTPARKLADQLTTLVAQLSKTIKCTPRPGLSVGVCCISELPSPVPSDILKEADRRLYEIKHAHHGRRKVA
jgi:diguanylate cyclase (GGDEF)-like protein